MGVHDAWIHHVNDFVGTVRDLTVCCRCSKTTAPHIARSQALLIACCVSQCPAMAFPRRGSRQSSLRFGRY